MMKKPDKVSLSPSEMKGEKVNPRGDQLKCPFGYDALNCDSGSSFSGYITDYVDGIEYNVGIYCTDGNTTYPLYCSGYGSGSGTVSDPDNDVDACAGLSSGADCNWLYSGVRHYGTCTDSKSGTLYCKKKGEVNKP